MDSWAAESRLDRAEARRAEPGWVEALWADPAACLLVVDEDGDLAVAAGRGGLALGAPAGDYDPEAHWLLGLAQGRPYFVATADVAPTASLRELSALLADTERELATAAVALTNWHRADSRCGVCGSATSVAAGGLVRRCRACGRDRFPRTDPAVIVAVLDDADRLLLGHHVEWAAGRMSLLAGFVSAGESLEQAARREVAEEAAVPLGAIRYLGSQPWPFPRSLMVGFVARALDTPIVVDARELESARWFTPSELEEAVALGVVLLPGPASIAHRIIGAWRRGELPAPEDS